MDQITTNTADESFRRAFRPRSVAILGASNDPARISGRALHYMLKAGYDGAIYPVNNRRDTVQGVPAFATLDAVPDVPDVALLALSAAQTLDAVRGCVAKGVGAAVIYAAGFAEISAEGAAVQDEIVAVARAGGLRLFGPNCLGLFHAPSNFMGTFTSALDEGIAAGGNVAVVCQSGAYAGHLAYLCRLRNVGVSYWVSTGNEADTDVAACIEWLARQDDVAVIMAYAEGVRDGARFVRALETAHAYRKPIVFMKVGVSDAGAVAAQSHTASLAGADAVYDALFKQYGVYRAETTEQQVDIAYACSRGVYPAGRRVGIITVSGGFGIQACDAAERCGLDVAPLPEAAQARLRTINPMGGASNPCDTTAGWLNDMSIITKTFEVMYEEGGYESVLGSFTMLPGSPTFGEGIRQAIAAGTSAHMDRPTVLCMAASEAVVRSYDEAGFLVFPDTERATQAIAALAWLREQFDRPVHAPAVLPGLARDLGREPLSEGSAQRVLGEAGIPFPPSRIVGSEDAAASAATAFGYPVVMKIVSPDILHKTEIGGVILSIADEAAARLAYATLRERAATHAPAATIEGVLVVPMAPKGVETIMGVNRDPVFGPVVMFGLGGIFTELFRDVTFRLAPFDRAEAHRMIAEVKGIALLRGFRGKPAADVEALAETLERLSHFAAANAETLETIDLNPLLVLEAGKGVLALDAVVLPRRV